MNESLKKFQTLLRELFLFDCADLDFGIYRIMNHKRDVIEQFIAEDLPNAIAGELDSGALADQSQAAKELKEVAEQIRNTLAGDAIDADGNLVKFQESEIGKKYLSLQSRAAGSRGRDALEVAIFNHLYAFFSRYYQEGDFISKRRYSKNQRYAIPYNGEEVYLHWANSDQYYVKTAEYFHDYTYRSPNGITVYFKMQGANVEQNNVKGDKRFFLPRAGDVVWDEDAREVVIPFEYRPLTQQEEVAYGKSKQQDAIIAKALKEIPEQLKEQDPLTALLAKKSQHSDDEAITFFEHHLRQYTRRNTSDFFIHKDLMGFLSRELDFYLKNEVLSLDEMEAAGEDHAEGWFQMMRIIKSVGGRIIYFLNQIENFQKMLWEKRKFITETQYCITVGCINENFYADIATCEAQWTEWKALLHIDEEDQINLFNSGKDKKGKRLAFLQAHPTLVLDTAHFDRNFIDQLLASLDDLDGMTDGLLIQSESWQTLNLLQEKYQERVNCIYIDPLYNTGQDDFLYKDNYQHSTWLSMMDNLMLPWQQLLPDSGFLVSHIDEHEFNALDRLINMRFGAEQNIGPIIWDKRNPKGDATAIASQHEYICWAVKDYNALKGDKQRLSRRKENGQAILMKANELIRLHGGVTTETQKEFRTWVRRQNFSGGEKAYCELDKNGAVYRSVSMAWPNRQQAPPEYFQPLIHPVENKPCPVPARGWRNPPDTMKDLLDKDLILFGPDASTQPTRKYLLRDNFTENVPSLYYFGGSDDSLQKAMGYYFPTPKPVRLGEYVISIATSESDSIVLDSFAGSGTTGHAVINLNREDGRQRKFILVEMGEYFDTVLLPRIKKVTFSPEWKEVKPKRMATPEEAERSPRIVKYMRLESYEDALNNIAFDETSNQTAMEFDDYLIKYMLKWETRASGTLLNVEKLARPFCYTLLIYANGQTHEQEVDIPETFNYLLGLHVETRRVYDDDGRHYLVYRGQTREGRRVAVIWRETEGWDKADQVRDKEFVAEQKLSAGADEVFVNGDSFIREAKALEPMFKARMFVEMGE